MKKTKLALAIAATAFASSQAYATNGMNMDGYGPISQAMGGTAQAYNNGLGGMMNNPATMGMGSTEGNKIQVALGNLRPDVKADFPGQTTAKSSSDSFLMPGFGYATKKDGLTWGVGVLAQGGMGTKYDASSFLQGAMSQVSVGRLVFPLNYEINEKFTVGGSIDYVWAGMDMVMDMGGGNVLAFDDGSDYSGQAQGTGFGGKLGFTFKASDTTTIGASYHTKTALSDLTTSKATFAGSPTSVSIVDFQWPSTVAFGLSTKPTEKWVINADIKRINWAETMKDFKVKVGSNPTQSMPQNWEDQNVIMIGAQYDYSDKLKLRAGANLSTNPVPDSTLNPLFPAIIENHYTAGFGYSYNKNSGIDFSLSYAPEVSQTNPNFNLSGQPLTSKHSQISWQAMYTYKWGVKK